MKGDDLERSGRGRLLIAGLKVAIGLVVVWGIGRTVRNGWDELAAYKLSLDWFWLFVCGALYLVGLFPSALFWRRILFSLGERPGWLTTIRAYYVGHLGKYVPGKATVVILRIGLLRGATVRPVIAGLSVFLETLTMMAVGACLASLLLVYYLGWGHRLTWLAAGVFLVAILPTLPPVFRFLARRLRPKSGAEGSGQSGQELDRVTGRLMLGGWVANLVGWTLLGMSFWALLRAMGTPTSLLVEKGPLIVASVALAVVAGFLSLLPGGAGVRDWVLAELMIPAFGEATAIVAVLLLRLAWLVSELVISGILYIVRPKGPKG